MAKRKRGRIVGHVLDAGEYGPGAAPGGEWYITEEDSQRLTPEEMFQVKDAAPIPRKARGPAAGTAALFVATLHYERNGVGIDAERPLRTLLVAIGRHAVRFGLDGCELIDPDNGSQRELLGRVIAGLRLSPSK
jgi:hypothetical protein